MLPGHGNDSVFQFTHENPKAQKYLLGAFEKLCEDHSEALVPRVAHVLKQFYDTDIVVEEVRTRK